MLQGRLYVGGRFSGLQSDNNYIVMEYDIGSGEWATLPPYIACYFGMAAIDNQLVLVSGCDHSSNYSKMLGVWEADHKA